MSASELTVAGNCYTPSTMPEDSSRTLTATEVASQPWPIDYSAAPYFSACTIGSTCTTVSGIDNVPPYCTQTSTSASSASGFDFTNINGNAELPVSGNVYCAIGTGRPNDPKTWNGTIQIEASDPANGCNTPYPQDTFIGGNVSFITDNGGGTAVCLSPAADNYLIYSTGNISIYNGTFNWTGDIFDPNGTIHLGTANAGGDSDTTTAGMIEGNNVVMQNVSLTITGDGTVPSGTPGVNSSSSGTDALEQ